MPLPEKALEYLPSALSALKKTGGWIHYYDFQHAPGKENPSEKTKLKVAEKLDSLGVSYMFANSRVMRPHGSKLVSNSPRHKRSRVAKQVLITQTSPIYFVEST